MIFFVCLVNKLKFSYRKSDHQKTLPFLNLKKGYKEKYMAPEKHLKHIVMAHSTTSSYCNTLTFCTNFNRSAYTAKKRDESICTNLNWCTNPNRYNSNSIRRTRIRIWSIVKMAKCSRSSCGIHIQWIWWNKMKWPFKKS